MHHEISIDEEDLKKRPDIIKFYNKTKICVDLVDQMVGTYTCRRQTRRWRLKLFFNLLGVAALNAYTIYRQVHPDQQSRDGNSAAYAAARCCWCTAPRSVAPKFCITSQHQRSAAYKNFFTFFFTIIAGDFLFMNNNS